MAEMISALDVFRASIDNDAPDEQLPPPLKALWWLEKGDWHKAHEIAQSDGSAGAAWVHAHLHRVKGDNENAGYWYRRAGRTRPERSLDKEWAEVVGTLLEG